MAWQSMIENGGNCKVRKRGGSSSSSSTLRSTYRLKRLVKVGKRGVSSSPVPQVCNKMMNTTTTSPSQNHAKSNNYSEGKRCEKEKGKEFLVSARKLGATLWHSNGLPTPEVDEVRLGKKERVLKSNSKAMQFPHPSQGHVSQRIDTSKLGAHKKKASASSHKILQTDYSFESGFLMETRNGLKDVGLGLTTSKQLLEVLSQVWCVEEQQSTCVSLFSALKTEVDRARIRVAKLIKKHKYSRCSEIDLLLEQFEREKAAWKIREQYRIHSAIASISEELKKEKKLRRQAERLNKKLGRELADTKASAKEKNKAKEEILEQICEENRAKVEEKKAAFDRLRSELQVYLGSNRRSEEESIETPNYQSIKMLGKYKENEEDKEEDDDSEDSELHSIELNMDDNSNSKWSSAFYNDPKKLSRGRKWEFNFGGEGNQDAGSLYLYNNNNKGGFFESESKAWKKDETERYNMIRDLKEQMVVSASRTSSQDFTSPSKTFDFI